MDTKYFLQALDEWRAHNPYRSNMPVGELPIHVLSELLHRAQDLKLADQTLAGNPE